MRDIGLTEVHYIVQGRPQLIIQKYHFVRMGLNYTTVLTGPDNGWVLHR